MHKSSKKTLLISTISLLLLQACIGRNVEQFHESFFAYEDKGKQYFSFILELKGNRNLNNEFEYIDVNGKPQDEQIRRNKDKEVVARPEDPKDAQVPLKFRMEEIAHSKLKQKLDATNLCPNGRKLENDEFANYTYKIKGSCINETKIKESIL